MCDEGETIRSKGNDHGESWSNKSISALHLLSCISKVWHDVNAHPYVNPQNRRVRVSTLRPSWGLASFFSHLDEYGTLAFIYENRKDKSLGRRSRAYMGICSVI